MTKKWLLGATLVVACSSDAMNEEPYFCDERTRHTEAPLIPKTYAPFLDFDEGGASAAEIALTFDDGPDWSYTQRVLDTLKSTGVRATFFINTKNAIDVDNNSTGRALVQRMVNEGHHVGNHTVHHQDLGSTSTNVSAELTGVLTTLRNVAPSALATRLWRAPYGNPWFGPQSRLDTLAPTFAKAGVHIGWDIDSVDWACGTAQCVIDNVLNDVDAGKSGVVLLHSINALTASALPTLISRLKSRGKRFIFVEDLVVRKYGARSTRLIVCSTNADCYGGDRCGSDSRCSGSTTTDTGVDTGAVTDAAVADTSVGDAASTSVSLACGALTVESGAIGGPGAPTACSGGPPSLASSDGNYVAWLERIPRTSAYATFTMPTGVTVDSLRVDVRFLGDDATEPLWYFYARNVSTGTWTLLGDNSWAGNWVWTDHSFTVPSPSAHVDALGRIQVRMTTLESNNSAELDRLRVQATYH